MGNQAALSGLSRVPQGCLFGAEMAVTVCKGIFEEGVYGSIRHTEANNSDYLLSTLAADNMLSRVFFFILT